MRSGTVGFLGLLFLASCAEPTPYDRYRSGVPLQNFPYKVGATEASSNGDITNCQIEAAQRVPQQLASHTTPTYQTPAQTTCNRIGTQTFCSTTGGQTYGGQTTIYDANAELRGRAEQQCMVRNGYRYLQIPACPASVTGDSLVLGRNGGLPPITVGTCYIVFPDGRWLIGNRT
jgi:hypothetical protein